MKSLPFILPILVITSCNSANTNTTNNSNNTRQPATAITTPPPKNINTPVDLKVIVLPTADGGQDGSEVQKFQYPATITVNITDTFGDKIAAFGTAYQVWIGPKGWNGKSEVGVDGTVAVHLFPKGDSLQSDPHIFFYDIPACQGYILASAALYFPAAMKAYNKYYNQGHSNPVKVPKNIHINQVSPTLVTYTFPVKNGLLTQGVAYYIPPDSNDAYYAEAKFVFPQEQSKLADFLMNTYIIQRKLN